MNVNLNLYKVSSCTLFLTTPFCSVETFNIPLTYLLYIIIQTVVVCRRLSSLVSRSKR
uniref:Uncharacterized protein n=1 Tax=Anopheles atroparvus TaxID=41427 RepID=A0AAG5DQZ1_ANOAO